MCSEDSVPVYFASAIFRSALQPWPEAHLRPFLERLLHFVFESLVAVLPFQCAQPFLPPGPVAARRTEIESQFRLQ